MKSMIEEHYREHYDRLLRVVMSKGMPKFLAEEIVQETYTRALEMEHSYEDTQPFDKWINQILNNAAKDTMKQERHRGMVFVPKDVFELFDDAIEAFKEANDR